MLLCLHCCSLCLCTCILLALLVHLHMLARADEDGSLAMQRATDAAYVASGNFAVVAAAYQANVAAVVAAWWALSDTLLLHYADGYCNSCGRAPRHMGYAGAIYATSRLTPACALCASCHGTYWRTGPGLFVSPVCQTSGPMYACVQGRDTCATSPCPAQPLPRPNPILILTALALIGRARPPPPLRGPLARYPAWWLAAVNYTNGPPPTTNVH